MDKRRPGIVLLMIAFAVIMGPTKSAGEEQYVFPDGVVTEKELQMELFDLKVNERS